MSGFDEDGLSGIPAKTAQAAAALESLKAPAEKAARSIDEAFARAGSSLARSLARAASDGEVSLAELARAVIGAAGAAIKGGGLAGAVAGVFSGARADGGPVAGGGAYLVGERGPEVFRPTSAGSVEPLVVGGSPIATGVLLVLWGAMNTAMSVIWMTWMSQNADDAPEAAGSLMVAAIQAAILLGAVLGGLILDQLSITATLVASVLLAAVAVLIVRDGRALLKPR